MRKLPMALCILCISVTANADSESSTCTPEAGLAVRLRPPESLSCVRDHLTSFSGCVIGYQHTASQTIVRLSTDEDTQETFTLNHPQGDLEKWLLIDAVIFQSTDWARIESAPGQLNTQLRAVVWVCDNNSNPIIDWRPAAH